MRNYKFVILMMVLASLLWQCSDKDDDPQGVSSKERQDTAIALTIYREILNKYSPIINNETDAQILSRANAERTFISNYHQSYTIYHGQMIYKYELYVYPSSSGGYVAYYTTYKAIEDCDDRGEPDHYLEVGDDEYSLYFIYPDSCYHWYYESDIKRFSYNNHELIEESPSLPTLERVISDVDINNMPQYVESSIHYEFNPDDMSLIVSFDKMADNNIIYSRFYHCSYVWQGDGFIFRECFSKK